MSKKIGIFHYPSCNLVSLKSALLSINTNLKISEDIKKLNDCDKIIIPGVGNMKVLERSVSFNDLKKSISQLSKNNKIIYGICLGFQLFFDKNEESGNKTLCFFDGDVKNNKLLGTKLNVGFKNLEKFKSKNTMLKKLFKNIDIKKEKFYFLHSYHAALNIKKSNKNVEKIYSKIGDKKFLSLVFNNNILGTQFHPELSKETGKKFLKNFCEF